MDESIFQYNSEDILPAIKAMTGILRVDRTPEGIQDALKTLFLASSNTIASVLMRHRIGSSLFVLSGAKESAEHWKNDPQSETLYRMLEDYYICFQKRYQMAKEVAKYCIGLLNNVGIQPLIVKGIMLAESLYEDPAMRTFGDFDFIFSPEEYQQAYDAMSVFQNKSKTGISSSFVTNPGAEDDFLLNIELKSYGEIKYMSIPEKILGYNYQREMTKAYAKSKSIYSSIGNIRILGESDLLQYLCTHYMKHLVANSASLASLFDIALLICKYDKSLDWDEILRSSKGNLMYPPLKLSSRWLGSDIPYTALKKLKTNASRVVQRRVEIEAETFESVIYKNKPRQYSPRLWSSRSRLIFLALFPSIEHLENLQLMNPNTNLFIAYLGWFKRLWNTYIIKSGKRI